MKKQIHTLIIGAGPAGLAAAYTLAKAGFSIAVIEKDQSTGGLMRSLKHDDFILDIGRKELYTRISKVNGFWEDLLGEDYVSYSHREGILYDGVVLETSKTWCGIRRGMPFTMLFTCALDLLSSYFKYSFSKPKNYTEYWYSIRGKKLSQILSQGYEEKFNGISWDSLPVPENDSIKSVDNNKTQSQIDRIHQQERNKPEWRHPAKGSGQICEKLEQEIRRLGGEILINSEILELKTSKKTILTVKVAVGSKIIDYQPEHLISSIPAQHLSDLLGLTIQTSLHKKTNDLISSKRSTICLYLFFDEPPGFPHVWLKVSCPQLKAGRITNYAAFKGKMVPKGKTCLCIEFFCVGDDPLLKMSNEDIKQLGISECAKAKLANTDACIGFLVLKLRGVNAATSARNWARDNGRNSLKALNRFENLYYVNRPGTDKATYAGIEAATSIMEGDRGIYDREIALTLSE